MPSFDVARAAKASAEAIMAAATPINASSKLGSPDGSFPTVPAPPVSSAAAVPPLSTRPETAEDLVRGAKRVLASLSESVPHACSGGAVIRSFAGIVSTLVPATEGLFKIVQKLRKDNADLTDLTETMAAELAELRQD